MDLNETITGRLAVREYRAQAVERTIRLLIDAAVQAPSKVNQTSGAKLAEIRLAPSPSDDPALPRYRCVLPGEPLIDEGSWIDASHCLGAAGKARIVALTLGHRGALLVTQNGAWRAEALPIKPVSAVGAGDSFLGAMIWALATGLPIDDAFRYGVAGGSAALLAPGTELCHAADVHQLVDRVVVQPVVSS